MAAAGAKGEASGGAADTDLPKGAVKRILKAKLDALGEGNIQLQKDATLALAESAKVLISFLTVTANDICKEKKRQTISADDVFAALDDLDFADLVAPLQVALDGAPHRRGRMGLLQPAAGGAWAAGAAIGGPGTAAGGDAARSGHRLRHFARAACSA